MSSICLQLAASLPQRKTLCFSINKYHLLFVLLVLILLITFLCIHALLDTVTIYDGPARCCCKHKLYNFRFLFQVIYYVFAIFGMMIFDGYSPQPTQRPLNSTKVNV